jgi:tRNA(fMet)-specific endonuclease VapC
MKYLLDTDICVAIIRKRPAGVIHKLTSFRLGDMGVSSVTVAELHLGVQKSQRPEQNQQALDQFLLPLEIVAFDYAAAVEYGRIRAKLERAVIPIGSLDLLIAAHALSLEVILATANVKQFSRIARLRLEDWLRTAS